MTQISMVTPGLKVKHAHALKRTVKIWARRNGRLVPTDFKILELWEERR